MNERERKTNDTVNEKPANNKKGITRLKYAAVSLLVRNVLILISHNSTKTKNFYFLFLVYFIFHYVFSYSIATKNEIYGKHFQKYVIKRKLRHN